MVFMLKMNAIVFIIQLVISDLRCTILLFSHYFDRSYYI
jgi:hypothetical protein